MYKEKEVIAKMFLIALGWTQFLFFRNFVEKRKSC